MYRHETIAYDSILPAKITLSDSSVDRCRGEPHWHEEIQLIISMRAACMSPSESRSLTSAQETFS